MSIETLRAWSQGLLWISVILPIAAALAVGARYYVELRIGRSLSEQSKAEIGAIQSKLQTSEQGNERLHAELETRKVEIGQLQARTSPRRLSDAQRETLVSAASKAPGAKVLVACKLLDGESCGLAEQIAAALRAARWLVDPVNKTSLDDLAGVVAVYRPFEQMPMGFSVLVDGLKACGVAVRVGMLDAQSSHQFGLDKVYIVVGRKGP